MSSIVVKPAQPIAVTGDDLTAAELVGALIVWQTEEYAEVETRYGMRPKATVELVVADGDHAGHHPHWTVFGRMAREIGEQETGVWMAARVARWERGGKTGYGLDLSLEDDDLAAARAAVAEAMGVMPKAKRPPVKRKIDRATFDTPEKPKTHLPF